MADEKSKRGGPRPGAGRKPKPGTVVMRQLGRMEAEQRDARQAEFAGRMAATEGEEKLLNPLDVMHDNMVYFHEVGAKVLTALTAQLETKAADGTELTPDERFTALMELLNGNRMRQQSQDCARDLAKYTNRQMAPKPFVPEPADPAAAAKTINHIPAHPDAVQAFRRVAMGLAPLERKSL